MITLNEVSMQAKEYGKQGSNASIFFITCVVKS